MAEMDIERMFRDAGDWNCRIWWMIDSLGTLTMILLSLGILAWMVNQ
jgi:hypothetical protein